MLASVLAVGDIGPEMKVSGGAASYGPLPRPDATTAIADEAGVDGTGITVGTLSDSFACHPPAFVPGAPTSTKNEDISNDELPRRVNILSEGPCGDAIDEGRGMAQLVHDVAPGANIAFHTAFNGELDFAEGIIELADDGANVIVDDVRYFAEPFFMDGMIAQAVDIVMLDVRPQEEFLASHLPFARSMPLTELRRRLQGLPKNKPVVAYCRGPFCLMAGEAVALLRRRGYRARRLEDGVAEWRFHGLPLATQREER